ncbi:hypothetical protein [Mucilaginibacter sp. OK283]|uniref:hypothetical protein n=1 Tax=Mucilaginibacter sp. OK283 TaxID=1881049 RepID=UPI0015A5BE01|nr:hypothetical protein [Mucilaginibacter sp. OK283]
MGRYEASIRQLFYRAYAKLTDRSYLRMTGKLDISLIVVKLSGTPKRIDWYYMATVYLP